MAGKEFKILKEHDIVIFESIFKLSKIVNLENDSVCTISFGQGIKSTSGTSIFETKNNNDFKQILNMNSFLIEKITVNVKPSNPKAIVNSIMFERQLDSPDKVSIEFNNCPYSKAAEINIFIYENFNIYDPIQKFDRSLETELSDFYRRREENIIKLENLSHKLIEQNEEYRRTVDKELIKEKEKLTVNYDNLNAELNSDIKKQKEALDAREKELDDRKSTHARRQLRNEIKKELKNRSEKFNLTKTTMRKRWPIHLLFILLICFVLSFLTISLYKGTPTDNSSNYLEIYYYIRLSILGISLVVTLIFYIHWNDRWAQIHADEEFRLKRLDIDIDRASWIVEMAMEWQAENKNELPKDLLDKLSSNLFSDKKSSGITEHPYEELIRMLLSVSAEAKIPIPGGGELRIDKQGMKSLAKSQT